MKKKDILNINGKLEQSGVVFVDIENTYIDATVKIGRGSRVYPGVVIEGETEIGENCVIGISTRIVDSCIGDNVEIQASHVLESRIDTGTKVGPFAYLRPKSNIGKNCKIGDFVEVKNSNFGDGSKASHLTYIGDSDIGKSVNLGCGVVFVNYDGSRKYRSNVEDGAFIGCNSNLVSPVDIKKNSYIAAGSTVTEDVPEDALFIARSKGCIKENWVSNCGILKKDEGGK